MAGLWQRMLNQAEEQCDAVARRSRHLLPAVARVGLTATFFEDGLRMYFRWHEQCSYLEQKLNCSSMLAVVIVFICLVGQLLGCALVVLRLCVNHAVTLLAAILLLQVQVYAMPFNLKLFLRNFALLGGLLLLHVDVRKRSVNALYTAGAGLPQLIETRPQQYMHLTGRTLVAFMYMTLLQFELELLSLAQIGLGMPLMALIVLGYRTRLAASTLAALLTLWNVCMNGYWWFMEDPQRDIMKYNCFHTLSVIGGLLLVTVLGPGEVSLDLYKKQW